MESVAAQDLDLAVLAAPAFSNADAIALNFLQGEAVHLDPAFADGHYYEAADGEGPYRGLALARRMALHSNRSPTELNDRLDRKSTRLNSSHQI